MEPLGRSAIRREILHLFFSEPGLETHPRELARLLPRAAPPVVRELRELEKRRILISRPVGPLKRYRLARTPEAEAARDALQGRSVFGGADESSHDGRLLRLHARVADKLRQDPDRVMAKAYANLDRWQEIDPRGNQPWIRSWTEILERGPAEVALMLVEDGEQMRELRQSSPFAGVLGVAERLQVIREGSAVGADR
jgi:hypothetical protein